VFYFDKLRHWEYNTKYNVDDHDVKWSELRWVMRKDSGLICLNMPVKYLAHEKDNEDDYKFNDSNSEVHLGDRGHHVKQFSVADFRSVDIGGAYSILIRQGSEAGISADGRGEEALDDVKVVVENGVLKVKRSGDFSQSNFENDKRIGLVITVPSLEKLVLSGVNKMRVTGFKNLSKLDIDISGVSRSEIDVETEKLALTMAGLSKLNLKGTAQASRINLSGACRLDAVQMTIQDAEVDASGASKAVFARIPNIVKNATGASKIEVLQ
jgi:hypothetical protein